MLGHDLFLYPELSAAENLAFFARAYGVARCRSRVSRPHSSAPGSTERDDPVAGRFSRGMRQRLALERALLHEPRLVLLDEPFTGLDDAATGGASRTAAPICARPGASCCVTTHDLETIDGVADRAVLLQKRPSRIDRRRARVAARTLPPANRES